MGAGPRCGRRPYERTFPVPSGQGRHYEREEKSNCVPICQWAFQRASSSSHLSQRITFSPILTPPRWRMSPNDGMIQPLLLLFTVFPCSLRTSIQYRFPLPPPQWIVEHRRPRVPRHSTPRRLSTGRKVQPPIRRPPSHEVPSSAFPPITFTPPSFVRLLSRSTAPSVL